MAVPVSYTAEQLASFVRNELGDVGAALGWTDTSDQVAEAVVDVALIMQLDDVSEATNVRVLRATARVCAWRAAVKGLSAQFTFSEENGVSYNRSDLQKMALAALAVAESEAGQAGDTDSSANPGIKVGSLTVYDPYAPGVA